MLEVEYPSSWLMRTYVPAKVVAIAGILSPIVLSIVLASAFYKLGILDTQRRLLRLAIVLMAVGGVLISFSARWLSRRSEMLIDKQRRRIRYAGRHIVRFDDISGFALKTQFGGVLRMDLQLKNGKSWTVVRVSEKYDPLARQRMGNLASALAAFAAFQVHER